MKKLAIALSLTGLMLVNGTLHASDGASTYKLVCASCHDSKASDAPKLNDRREWIDRLAKGTESLYESTVNGKCEGVQQLRTDLSNDDIKIAVDYMVSRVR